LSAPKCPECNGSKVWKDGLRKTGKGYVQRYICRSCGLRFSETSSNGSDSPEYVERVDTKRSYRPSSHMLNRRVCDEPQGRRAQATPKKVVNLVTVEPQIGKAGAGATKTDPATIRGKIVEFVFWMEKEGYKELTIKGRTAQIKRLVNLGANLWDPESVKDIIAKQKTWGDGQKRNVIMAYNLFLQMEKMSWDPPRCKYSPGLPFIPLEEELNALINSCGKKTGTFLQGLKDTGADPGELAAIKWTDINYDSKTVGINHPVKGHNPRILSVSDAFLRRVNMFPKTSEKVFKYNSLQSAFYNRQRKSAARKLGNPRLLKITFITFRHWKGTMEYHRTKDILYVKKILGHKSIQNTLIYIDLEIALFARPSEEFTARVATNTEEACGLVEVGFEYVTGEYDDGGKIFRKRK